MRAPEDPGDHTPGRVELEVDRRFADMDLLGHVNNVRYLDYVAAGREDLLSRLGLDPGAVAVRRHRIGFVAPMVFGRAPAQVTTWVVGVEAGAAVLAQEVGSRSRRGVEPPTVHLRTETELVLPAGTQGSAGVALGAAARGSAHAWRGVASEDREPRHRWATRLRTRDLGPGDVARDDTVMELFQESRVRYFMDLHTAGEQWGHVVVAHTDLDFLAPVRPGVELTVGSWVAHVGGSSFTLGSALTDGRTTLARTTVVMVCFDADTQRPAPMAPAQRARLLAELDD